MRAGHQAVRWKTTLGLIVQFRAFCCDIDSDGIMGVAKEPVPVLDLSANVLCLGDTLTWDLRDSYAPGSTIDAYAIDMDDGTQYFVDNGTHVYGAVGTYTIEGTVHEGTCRQQTVEAQVEVIDCDKGLFASFSYASLDGDGVWFYDFTATAPAWTQRSDGLDTVASTQVNSIALRPGHKSLPDTVHELYACTDGGLYKTYNGGRSWGKITLPDPSNAEFADAPAATVDELIFHKLCYSWEDPDIAWLLASKPSASRVWVYLTEDSGISWTSRGLVV
jgi:hypothetical protein